MDFPVEIDCVIQIPLTRRKTGTSSNSIIEQFLHVIPRDEIFHQESVTSTLRWNSSQIKITFYPDFTKNFTNVFEKRRLARSI